MVRRGNPGAPVLDVYGDDQRIRARAGGRQAAGIAGQLEESRAGDDRFGLRVFAGRKKVSSAREPAGNCGGKGEG